MRTAERRAHRGEGSPAGLSCCRLFGVLPAVARPVARAVPRAVGGVAGGRRADDGDAGRDGKLGLCGGGESLRGDGEAGQGGGDTPSTASWEFSVSSNSFAWPSR